MVSPRGMSEAERCSVKAPGDAAPHLSFRGGQLKLVCRSDFRRQICASILAQRLAESHAPPGASLPRNSRRPYPSACIARTHGCEFSLPWKDVTLISSVFLISDSHFFALPSGVPPKPSMRTPDVVQPGSKKEQKSTSAAGMICLQNRIGQTAPSHAGNLRFADKCPVRLEIDDPALAGTVQRRSLVTWNVTLEPSRIASPQQGIARRLHT